MLTITEQLKTGNFSRFHLVYGEERYMVRYYRNSLKEKLSQPEDEMNCTVFQGDKANPSAIADVAQILPFMAPQRLIVVQDSGFFKNASDMVDFMDTFPDTTYLVFVEREVDKRNRLYKWMSKNGCITECKAQNAAMLAKWIAGYAKRADKAISTQASELLVERVGTDMELLSGEIEKLIGYVGERHDIEISDVEAISSGVTVSRIFEMIDAVALGEKEKALKLYDDLLANKESPMSILYLFSRHINILLQIKELSALGASQGEIVKSIGIPPFTVKKYARQAGLFKRSKLLQMLEKRADYEEKFKNGKLSDQLAVELFLIQALTNS
ncbi:MAG: DNA polymerase III subunit delta [Eubacterium sp.]|nr:DNA polymerase III subunit delta [Eubacterium sp.]